MELMLDFLQEELIGVEVYMEEFVRRLLRADGCYLDHYLMEWMFEVFDNDWRGRFEIYLQEVELKQRLTVIFDRNLRGQQEDLLL